MLKTFFALIFLFGAVEVQGQTVTDGLLTSQADLALGHTFFEETISQSRRDLSQFIENDVGQLIDSHMEAYESIKTTSLETTAAIDALEVDDNNRACINAIRSRWELQITRYGQRLSACIEPSFRSKSD